MSNPNASLDSNPNKKRRKLVKDDDHKNPSLQLRWRSHNDQRLYSTKLIQALSNTTTTSSYSTSSSTSAVKEAADKALATAANGKTRWSRAILKTRLRIMSKRVVRKSKRVTGNGGGRWRRTMRVAAVEKKVKTLGRLVPGCRKAALPSLLEETSDYIAALEMQVRAMTALAELLSGGSGSNTAASARSLNSES